MSQMNGKWLVDTSVSDAKLAQLTAANKVAASAVEDKFLRNDAADSTTGKLTAAGFDANSNKVENVSAPTASSDAANKAYVDSAIEGLDAKESCQAATTADISGTYAAGGGTGGTGAFTAVDLTAAAANDGFVLSIGDRLNVKDQTDAKQNGIYEVTTAGATGVMERASDHDGTPASEVSAGNFTFIENGTVNENSGWVITGTGDLTLNTDDINWTQFSGAGSITAGDGLTKTGNTLDVNTGDGVTITGDNVTFVASDVVGNGLEESTNNLGVKSDVTGGANLATNSINVAANGVSVKVDDSTIEGSAGQLRVKNDGITSAKINTAVAGNGLTGGGGSALSVDPDTTTGGGVPGLSVGANGVGIATAAAGNGLTGGGGSALAVQPDTTTGGGVSGLASGANGVGIATAAAGDGLTGGGGAALAVDLATNPGLEFNTAKLQVKVKAAGGVTRDADGLSVDVAALDLDDSVVEYFTLIAGDITAKKVVLTSTPKTATEVIVDVVGGPTQRYSTDYTVSGTDLSWSALGLDGILAATDELRVVYQVAT